ncbi:hypothetical protein BX666DRAFT_1881194 [Dichotomocladium elegans]|nr:hypothetical protein BX666DRAFT_1881194 [Dichotomocladium elegans]
MAEHKSTSARDYVDSYVRDQDLEGYLSKAQPLYDPTKTAPETTTSEENANASPQTTTAELHTGYDRHRPTLNPIPADAPTVDNSQQQVPQRPKVMWVVRDMLDQKREIHEKALDNCADLHVDLMTCFKDGSWWDKARMCENQKQKFWKCYQTQKDFLKKANYKGPVSTPEEDAKIEQEAILLSNRSSDPNLAQATNKQNE